MSETQSSNFLTSPTGAGLATAGASYALGNRGKGNPAKKAWQYKLKYGLPYENLQHEQNEFWRNRQIQGRVKDARAAGLHPLAALGISTGGSINPASANPGQLEMPGQSAAGSAIGEGLKAASAVSMDRAAAKHAKQMGAMRMQEQQLRNDWLETQIQNQRLKNAQIASNSQIDQPPKGPGEQKPGQLVFNEYQRMPTGKTTSSQEAEDRFWEIGGAVQGLLNMGYDLSNALSSQEDVNKLFGGYKRADGWTGSKDKYRWRKGGYRYTRKPVRRPKYPTFRHTDRDVFSISP